MKKGEINLFMAGRQQGKSLFANHEKLKRRILMGYIDGEVRENGSIVIRKNTKRVPYTTRQLVEKVTATFDRMEAHYGKRVCHINGKWQLQIRGKDLRRLLKAMPNVECKGRMLIDNGPVA